MDITQLRYFLMTAEELNYTRAAEKLFLSRQALRQALAAMEKELETPLFMNERNKLSLTAAGEYLLLRGKGIVTEFDAMLEGARRFAQRSATLKVALSTALFPFLMPETEELLKRFQQRYPAIRLDCSIVSNDDVLSAVMSGEVDCGGMIWMPYYLPETNIEVLSRYKTQVTYGEKYRRWAGRTVTTEDLAGHPCIGMGSLRETMRPVYEECLRKGLTLDYRVEDQTIDAFYHMRNDGVVGFDIDIGAPGGGDGLYSSPLEDYFWEVGVLYLENTCQNEAIQIFCRFVAEEYRRLKALQRQNGLSWLAE